MDFLGRMFKDHKALWVFHAWRVSLSRFRDCLEHMEWTLLHNPRTRSDPYLLRKNKADKLESAVQFTKLVADLVHPLMLVKVPDPWRLARMNIPDLPPLFEHSANLHHDIDWEGVKVLEMEKNWFRRGVKAAINIKRTNRNLNRDRGRHHLPSAYNRLINLRHVTLALPG